MMIRKWLNIISYKVNSTIKAFIFRKKLQKFRRLILNYFRKNPADENELLHAIDFLSKNGLTTFYGAFQEKYRYTDIEVFSDEKRGLPYVLTNNKRLYFKKSHNKRTVQLLFNMLLIEQDRESPHCYTDSSFDVESGDILADIGCAEGYFSLLNIEKLKKVYLFEKDADWVEALEATFEPWKEKVEIISKYVSNRNNSAEVRIDDFYRGNTLKPGFYKIDVEGAESDVLKGMEETLARGGLKMALCTYHNHDDFDKFSQFCEEREYFYKPNPGLMIYMNDLNNMRPPFFRKCLIKVEVK